VKRFRDVLTKETRIGAGEGVIVGDPVVAVGETRELSLPAAITVAATIVEILSSDGPLTGEQETKQTTKEKNPIVSNKIHLFMSYLPSFVFFTPLSIES